MTPQIYVFDDSNSPDAASKDLEGLIRAHLETKHPRFKEGLPISPKWNAGSNGGRLINNSKVFQEALEFCRDGKFSGLACFDFILKEGEELMQIDDETINSIQDKYPNIQLAQFNFKAFPGLLLAVATALNDLADVDICLWSSSGVVGSDYLEDLAPITKKTIRVFGSGLVKFGQYLLDGSWNPSVDPVLRNFKKAIDAFITTRERSFEDVMWPKGSHVWFDDRPKVVAVPHRHECFKKKYPNDEEMLRSELGQYLRDLATFGCGSKPKDVGADRHGDVNVDDAVLHLLKQEWAYRAIKDCVGAYSFLGGGVGTERPSLASLVLPLLAATGPAKWVQEIKVDECATARFSQKDSPSFTGDRKYGPDEVHKTKHLLSKTHSLFEALHRPEGGSDRGNVESVSVSFNSNYDFFSLILNFDSMTRTSKNGSRHPILTRSQFGAEKHDGSTMRAYTEFQKACRPTDSSEDRSVYSWFLPSEVKGITEFRIGVAKRDD